MGGRPRTSRNCHPPSKRMDLTINLANLPLAVRQSVCRGLQYEDRARHALGQLEQLRMKRLLDQVAVAGFNTDIGRTTMCISEDQADRARRVYGQLCFADPDFGKWLLRQNPEFRVKDVGTRVQSGWTGRMPKAECRMKKGAA